MLKIKVIETYDILEKDLLELENMTKEEWQNTSTEEKEEILCNAYSDNLDHLIYDNKAYLRADERFNKRFRIITKLEE